MNFWKRNTNENTVSSDVFPCGITSENITKLNPGEKFVFGSNLQGAHGGGAARTAVKRFGAIMGQGVGLQGDSYAIPTMQGGVETIRPYVDEFIEFAKAHPKMHFLVTKIGCGIAGFRASQIAPLFTNALMLSNVSLPKEFIEEIALRPLMPEHTRKKVYGQTRTLVDIACEMNKEKHFSSPKEVVDALKNFLEALRDNGDEIAWSCSFRCVNAFADKSFVDGKLDINKLQALIDAPDFIEDWATANIYRHYAVEKTIKMVELLNDFRRYTNPTDLKEDLFSVIDVSHCGPNHPNYYFSFGSPAGPYIQLFFCRYLERFWDEITHDGVLDNAKFKDFMYERHARGIEKYGPEAVIRRNFEQDSPCHPEVYVAYRGGAAPIYVEDRYYGRPQDDPCASRAYVKSCGEGKGPNGIENYFEFNRIKHLIERDEKYVIKADSSNNVFYCPKEDLTLPVYDCRLGKVHFLYMADKIQFLETLYDYDGKR